MGLRTLVARVAARRVHVLVVGVPGRRSLETAVDRTIRERGWVVADAPADADVLAVCGSPGPQLAEAIDRVWEQLPGPRVRVTIDDRRQIDTALDNAAVELMDSDRHRDDAHRRNDHPGGEGDASGHDHADHDEDAQMDHGSMAPAGIPLAEGADDRDGLEMDVAHLPLGPILNNWPAGVVVRCTLHGDVVVDSHVEVLDSDALPAAEADATPELVHHCSVIIDVLALAGAETAERQARAVRDHLLDSAHDRARTELAALRRTIRRSPILRWSLRDLGVLEHDRAQTLGVADHRPALTGDTYDRMLARLEAIGGDTGGVDPEGRPFRTPPRRRSRASQGSMPELLPELIDGLDLAATRLVIAGLGIDAVAAPVDSEGRGHQDRPSHRGHHHG
ncbi:hypothetical protein [Gordonia mangrovi]|uniref:hypothetical protein n=1 Tax=Gordonia mangrovi TaxID=2665643 RepID=UPI001F2E63B4|nr:hypothetical protein [Gordonia mangrovi]UVF76213.1 hypothetical protein NWF22_12425 [Gordonia mangrovi]